MKTFQSSYTSDATPAKDLSAGPTCWAKYRAASAFYQQGNLYKRVPQTENSHVEGSVIN